MNLCPAFGEPPDDFSPCACAFGHVRSGPEAVRKDAKGRPVVGGMRQMVERKLRHRALAAEDVVITPKR